MRNRMTRLVVITFIAAAAAVTAHAQYQPSVMYASLLTNISLIEKTGKFDLGNQIQVCLLYTSDAADE